MKNLKKVLAMVLAFACTFTMFAGAKVFEDVPAGSDYSEAITMLSDLGIIQGKDDGKYHPEDTITRAEACALIARMMTGDPNVSQYVGAQNFSDVVSGSWKDSAIGYCYINNIVIGVGNNKFEPDRAITDAEFITMVVRAMGYETPDMAQGYPYTYMSVAGAIPSAVSNHGILEGTNMVANTDALRGEDAQVIYNALFADYARGAKLVNTTHGTSVEQYPTLAESVWGLERAAVGVWNKKDDEDATLSTCKAHTWVITGQKLTVGDVDMFEAYPIEDGEDQLYDAGKQTSYAFTYNGDMANIADLKGYQVELWGMGAHDEPEMKEITDANGDKKKVYVYSSDWDINAIKTVKGQTAYDYNPSMADDKSSDGSIKTDSIDVDLDNVQNYTKKGMYSDLMNKKDVEEALNVKNSAQYRLVDWNSDGSVDFITSNLYDYYEVKSVSKTKVRLAGFDGKTEFVLDTDGETKDVDIGDKNGDAYTIKAEFPDDIEEGDILQVSTDEVVGKKEITSTWTVEVVEPETKEITSISSKKGVEFDDELIDVAHKDYSFKDTNKTYNDLYEDSADLWDLYRDANGFIIKMEEAEGAYNGYVFVTGAIDGDTSSTGKKDYAYVSGLNQENKVLDEVQLVKNASVKVWNGKKYVEGYDSGDREFNKAAGNIKGRVFKYTLNDDGDITKMYEVACENGSADYTYNKDTRAVKTAEDGNNWLQKASVIFAVEVENSEWNDFMGPGTPNITEGTELGMGAKDIDVDNVIAVDYKDVPDINSMNVAEQPQARGVKYNADASKDEIESVVLGVSDLNDFKSTSTKIGLLTELDYNSKGDKADTYDVVAHVNGMEEVEFNTIDYADMKINGSTKDQKSQINKINELIEGTKNNDAKYGVYAELRFNKDGKVTAINVLNESKTYAARTNPEYNYANTDSHYTVVRAVVNLAGDNDRLMVASAKGIKDGKEMKLESIGNAGFENYYKLTSDTAYFKVDDGPDIVDGEYMNAYEDAFVKDFDVATGDKADLVSWIDSVNDEYEDEYCVADVVIDNTKAADGKDVVAVYYYDDTVAEYGKLTGTLELNDTDDNAAVTYGTQVTADADSNDAEFGNRVKFEVKNAAGETVFSMKDSEAVAADAHVNLPPLPVGTYTVTAYGYNRAADRFQPMDSHTLTINAAARAIDVKTVANINAETEKDSYTAGEDVVFVVVEGQKDDADPTFTVLNNRRDVKYQILDARPVANDLNKVCYELKLDDVLEIAENGQPGDLVVELNAAPNYSKVTNKEDNVTVVAAPAAEYTQKLKVTGTSAADMKGTLTLEYTMDGMTVPQSVDINIWNSTSDGNPKAQDVAGWIAKQINDKVSGIEATAEDDATVVLTTKKPMELQVKSNTSKWNVALVK